MLQVRVACVLIVLAVPLVSQASQSEPHACATVVDPADRLVCYDAAFPPAAGVRTRAQDLEAERKRGLEDFGLSKVQMRENEPERMRAVAPDRIESRVAGVSVGATGKRTVNLENGQIWLLTEVTMKGHLERGDQVVIREAAMGSYLLVTPDRIALRARRIK
ncbi:hypothetical protein ACFFGH_33405 [Lysobacter korlensis]|uniref:Uncharacterized protein n=1 Tax=Lysobacter korlensis TaxID=553636 RepID=A0ABV6S0I4_9GAMM